MAQATTSELKEAYEVAKRRASEERTHEAREAATAAWAAYDASVPRRAPRVFASRAGRRQAQERRAERRSRA